jgi:hypothetical protein
MNLQGTSLIFGMKKCLSWTEYIKNDLNGNQKKNELYVIMVITDMII